MLKLYDYWRSSAAYRVRIVLNLKNIPCQRIHVHLAKGEQHTPAYSAVNPQNLLPTLEVDGTLLTQSLSIIEYLNECYPEPPLLPSDSIGRAQIRAMALTIAAEIHPLQNFRVLQYLRGQGQPDDVVDRWTRHWIESGMRAFEALVDRSPVQGRYCYGDSVTLADIFLTPQMANARRFGCATTGFGRLVEIDARLGELSAFKAAAPENHPEAPK